MFFSEYGQAAEGRNILACRIPQQIQEDVHIVAAFGQNQRPAGFIVVPWAAYIAVGKMIISDILVVLYGYHRAKAPAFDDLPDLFKKGGMSKHMANRCHLIGEGLRKTCNLFQLLQRGRHGFLQNQVIPFFQQPPNVPQMQLILCCDNCNVRKSRLRHQLQIRLEDLMIPKTILVFGAGLFGWVGISHRNHPIFLRIILL